MDERLKEVHQTDLTESRVNEEFVDWLKTKGPSWLLLILVAICAYLAMVRWNQHKDQKVLGAWSALLEANLPGSKGDVADAHAEVFGVPQLALIQGADMYLQSVQTSQSLGTSPDDVGGQPLSDEDRTWNLGRAEDMYSRVVAMDDGSLRMALHAINAMSGLAAVAEARGEFDKAREWYGKAADRAGSSYPELAAVAGTRADNLEGLAAVPALPENAAAGSASVPRDPARIEPALRELLTGE